MRIYIFYFIGVWGSFFTQKSAMAQNNAVIEAKQFLNDALSDNIPPTRRIMKLQAAVFVMEQDMKQQSPDRVTLQTYQQILEILIALLCEQKRYAESHQYYLSYQKTSPLAKQARKLYTCLKPALPQILGNLKVTSQPSQVSVLIKDGYGKEYVKTTPFSLPLPKGTVQLSVQHLGFLSYQETFQLEANTHTTRHIVLRQKENKIPPAPDKTQMIAWSGVSVAIVGAVAGSLFLVGALQIKSQSERIRNNSKFLSDLVTANPSKLRSEDYDQLSLSNAATEMQQQYVVSLAVGITFLSVAVVATGVSIGMFVHHRKKQDAFTADLPTQDHARSGTIRSYNVLFVSE